LFDKPVSPLLTCAGMARDWPDARGIWYGAWDLHYQRMQRACACVCYIMTLTGPSINVYFYWFTLTVLQYDHYYASLWNQKL